MSKPIISVCAGRPYGHVPGHSYYDVDIEVRTCRGRYLATLTITWGSAQGYDEEHGRLSYSASSDIPDDAIGEVKRDALADAEAGDDAVRGYIHTAASRAVLEACERCRPRRRAARKAA